MNALAHASSRKRGFGISLTVFGLICAAGYASALAARSDCELAMAADMADRLARAYALDGSPLSPSQIGVDTGVRWPFLVSVTYSVPSGIHRCAVRTHYLALPWGIRKLSSENFYFV